MLTEADALLRLALVPGLGPAVASRLLAACGSPGEVFAWNMERLQSVEGITGDLARRICTYRGDEQVAAERAACHRAGVRIMVRSDTDYPHALQALDDAPLALWLKGELQPRDRLAVSVAGSRRPSAYGHRQAHHLCMGLARVGATVVAGLGRGIDTVAHSAALEGGARTIAVLGSGFGRVYPDENIPLAERIADGRGAVLSELPFATAPSATTFPRRNRLIAAFALATLVIEAGNRDGALITARLSMELGREVLVVPGNIDNPECAGSNQLIRDGATLVASLEHILHEVEPLLTLAGGAVAVDGAKPIGPRASALSGREKQVYLMLADAPRTVADLVRVGDIPASSVSATLLSLELRRLVRRQPDGYVRAT
jgi:DNA processing protein